MNRAAYLSVLALLLLVGGAAVAGEAIPSYTRDMWLADSLATGDAAIVGTPMRDGDRAWIEGKVIWGERIGDGRIDLAPPYRCAFGKAGIYIVQRATGGYVAVNPDEQPLSGDEWRKLKPTSRPAFVPDDADENTVVRHVEERSSAGENVRRTVITSYSDGLMSTEVLLDDKRIFHRSFDDAGRLAAVFRLDEDGSGLSLAYERGKLYSYASYRAGKRDGLAREYFRHKPAQSREETIWKQGLRHGRCRTWDEDGKLLGDVVYEDGLIAPIRRYTGPRPANPPITLYTTPNGVFYKSNVPIDGLLRVGMTAAEVSGVLQVDFSEQSGLTFPYYTPRRLLHVAFKDGRIISMRQADNSVCFDPAPKTGRR